MVNPATKAPRRLVLCFDGTANKFKANRSDTNIVKIYQMLWRNAPDQFHYYQPGIGTYSQGANENAGSIQFMPKTRGWAFATLDQMFGISFVDHVLGGYKFVMRYYEPGDDIYILGFSRGAYTARFLAEMLHNVGLLSRGNEEMVHFAWNTFSDFQRSKSVKPIGEADAALEKYMNEFKKTFCRPGVDVHFLGLFDCVNSVSQFEMNLFRRNFRYITPPCAKHIRHAVSIHERRLKFKPALCLFEPKNVHLKEEWFAGNHGDVGGGWSPVGGEEDGYLLSDTTLKWMVDEMTSEAVVGDGGALKLDDDEKTKILKNVDRITTMNADKTLKKPVATHDMLKAGHGARWYMWIVWWMIEVMPVASRLELEHAQWIQRHFPPNLGASRDIPEDAVVNDSVTQMLHDGILDRSQAPVLGGSSSYWHNFKTFFGFGKRKDGEQPRKTQPNGGTPTV